jgi:hypothetical protein
MNWVLIVLINIQTPNPDVILERFPNQASCEVIAAKIRGAASDRIIDTECVQDSDK